MPPSSNTGVSRLIHTGLLSAALTAGSLFGTLQSLYAQDNESDTTSETSSPAQSKPSNSSKPSKPSITNEEIERLMKKQTVEEILEGAPVEYVRYDKEKGRTNFEELVYQRQSPQNQRRPVIVMFYANPDQEKKYFGKSQRAAIVFKQTSRYFSQKLKFVCFDQNVDPGLTFKNYSGLISKFGIRGTPSFAFYSFSKNEFSQIDIWKGGPLDIPSIFKSLDGMDYWIKINTDPTHPDYKKYFLGNSFEWKKTSE